MIDRMMIDKFVYYKHEIPVSEIRSLCDLAIEVEKTRASVRRAIDRGFVESKRFTKLQDLTNRFIYSLASVLRKLSHSDKEPDEVVKDLNKILQFSEFSRKKLEDEIMEQPFNFPMISTYISRVDEILHVYFMDVLKDVISIKKKTMRKEFVMSAYSRRGVKPSPEILKKLREEE
ncbi:MAG: hypothetical protein ACE5KD_00535 [Candidatus Bathyarchaeia archaeon]